MSTRQVLDAQRSHWERTYAQRPGFFGESASEPAREAMDRFEADSVRSLLELGSGQGRDTLFFLASGLAVTALDYADEGLEQIRRKGVEAQIAAGLTLLTADVREPLPINDSTFDACYSHMLFNMALATHELESLVAELHRVVRPGGLVVYTARNTSDSHFGAGVDHGDGMFEMGGFIVHFFDRALINRLAKGFELLDVREHEEGRLPRRLFSVTMRQEPMT